MNRLILLASTLALTVALTSSSAQAASAKPKPKGKGPKWVTLVHTTGDVPTDWPATLRTAAEGADTSRTWLPPPSLALEELQLTLGCASWGPACAGQAAGLLGADHALTIDVVAGSTTANVAIESVAKSGAVDGGANRVEVSLDDAGRSMAAAWVVGTVRGTKPTVLIVSSDLPGTEVLVDGTPRGVTPLTLIDVLPPGEHTLLLRREGRAPLTRTITLTPGVIQKEQHALAQGPAMTSTPTVGEKDPEPLPGPAAPGGGVPTMAIVGFGLAGTGVVMAGVGVALAATSYGAIDAVISTGANGQPRTRPGMCDNGDGSFSAPGTCESGMTPDEIEANRGAIDAWRTGVLEAANLGFVLGAAGVLVGVTGVVLGFGALSGEEQDGGAAPAAGSSASVPTR